MASQGGKEQRLLLMGCGSVGGVIAGGLLGAAYDLTIVTHNPRICQAITEERLGVTTPDGRWSVDAIVHTRLDEVERPFDVVLLAMKATSVEQAARDVAAYLAPEGYPTNPVMGRKIEIDQDQSSQALIHYASVDERDGEVFMSSSRALACTGIADTMQEAERIAEDTISRVQGPVFYRKDIGTAELLERRIAHMDHIRRGG